MGRNRTGAGDPSRKNRARRGVHGAPKGIVDIRLEIPPADQLGQYRQIFSGPHYGWQVVNPDANTRIATHPAKSDDLGSFACDLGISAIVLDHSKRFDGLWVRQNAGASTARIWVYEEARFIFEAFKAFLVNPVTGLPWSTTNPFPTDQRMIGGVAQTGVDVSLLFSNRGATPPATVAVGVASAIAVAARPGPPPRRGLYLRNTSLGAHRISLNVNGGVAVAGRGYTMGPAEWLSWDQLTGFPGFTNQINAISSIAGASMAIQESV